MDCYSFTYDVPSGTFMEQSGTLGTKLTLYVPYVPQIFHYVPLKIHVMCLLSDT